MAVALLGVLLSGATAVTINPARGDARTRADVEALGPWLDWAWAQARAA